MLKKVLRIFSRSSDKRPHNSSFAVKLFLLEKDIPHDRRSILDKNHGRAIIQYNPRAEVPLILTESGASIYDSTRIIEYLEEAYPNNPLLPKDPIDRSRSRMIENFMATTFEAVLWGLTELTAFRRGSENQTNRQAMIAKGREQVLECYYPWLEMQLGERDYFEGDYFGYADAATMPGVVNAVLTWKILPKNGSALMRWVQRISERDSVKLVLQEYEAVAKGGAFRSMVKPMQEGKIARQYRDHRLEWMIRTGGIDIIVDGLNKKNIKFTDDSRFRKEADGTLSSKL